MNNCEDFIIPNSYISTIESAETSIKSCINPQAVVKLDVGSQSMSTSGRRIVSSSSIADINQDSTGGTKVWASNEKASDKFANTFIAYVTRSIWPKGIILDWVQGREGVTNLKWNGWCYSLDSSIEHVLAPRKESLPRMENQLLLEQMVAYKFIYMTRRQTRRYTGYDITMYFLSR
jgi:hypothetical protein